MDSENGKPIVFEGFVDGNIVRPRGESFGWDPIFEPLGHKKTFGEMCAEEKNLISHRKKALDKLKEHLIKNSKKL